MSKKILLFANHNNGYEITKFLLGRKDAYIVAVVVLPDQKNQWYKSVQKLAKNKKLNSIVYTDTSSLYKKIKDLQFDLIISANWRYIISSEVLKLAKWGAVNYHNSLLPKYRGAYANAWAIESGEAYSGITLHWMSPSFDDGDIIFQKKVPILPTDTARELWERLNETFLLHFKEYWEKVDTWKKISKKQPKTRKFYSVKNYRDTNQLLLHKKMSVMDLLNKLRARTFLPYYKGAYFIDPKTKKRIFLTIQLKEDKAA